MGLFVAFEGVEGSGKSTQSRALKRRLAGAGYSVTLAHEPGGTPAGELIRRLLKRGPDIPPIAELLLFSASRAALVESAIRPALHRGEVVICDRYIYSTLAYQGYGRGLPLDTVRRLNEVATGGLIPHLVVLLDLPPEAGLARKSSGPADRFEQERQEFHERVRQGYLRLAKDEPARWLVLDASASKASLAKAVWERVSGMLR
jgi:dTMP kinase